MFASLLGKLILRTRPKPQTRPSRNTFRPAVELLESREVPSVSSLSFSGSTLVIRADNADTSVSVKLSYNVKTAQNYVVVSEAGTGRSWSYAAGTVSQIEFQGGAGNDRFVNNVSSLPVSAYGAGGNDYLEGRNAADYFFGGAGNDTLIGNGGDDTLSGDAGDDKVVGGDGDDYLYGGDGHDSVIGGAGADSLYGGAGDDTLVAIDGGTSDYADGQSGPDTVWADMNRVWVETSYGWQADIAYAEKLQNVSAFANGADRTLNGDAIADPTNEPYPNYKNYSANPLFAPGGPTVDDIDQERLGDCWLLASLGSVAHDHPGVIRSMVADFGDGTYGVRLGDKFYRI